ncbi:baseplate J/gp47 family protein [Bacillus sp. JJ1474]|uniref:baseplate J/gp47 family protein n=1 Tax=Bacillus sp. JJ1474 TaxID=3122955 RepID=UPI002FFE9314
MFENKTKETIHTEMLKTVSDNYDKTLGSFIYDSTEPVADQMSKGYKNLDVVVSKLSIDNLTGEELEKRVNERTGTTRKKATFATSLVTVNGQQGAVINIGDKVSSDTVNYSFQESKVITSSGEVDVLVMCDVAGTIGNAPANSIKSFPITLQGLTSVTNKESVTNGYEAESDTELLKRYYERIQTPPTSGNKAHYKNWAKEVNGVGEAKIFPLWAGDNTVKVVIIDSNKSPASEDLVADVQDHIDPGITGLGDGEAGIGAFCTVVSAAGLAINISFSAVKDPAFTDQQRQISVEAKVNEYLNEIAFVDPQLSYAKIGALILSSDGILDYSNLLINGGTSNILINDEEVPVLGVITID